MYIKITKSGPRRYVQLVEAYRDDQGNPRQRTVATLVAAGLMDSFPGKDRAMRYKLKRFDLEGTASQALLDPRVPGRGKEDSSPN